MACRGQSVLTVRVMTCSRKQASRGDRQGLRESRIAALVVRRFVVSDHSERDSGATLVVWAFTIATTLFLPSVRGEEEELQRFVKARTIKASAVIVNSVAVSRDGKRIVSGGRDLLVWDTATGEQLKALKNRKSVRSIAFSPDGQLIASCGFNGTVDVWDANTSQSLCTLDHPGIGSVRSVAFRSDGRKIASAGLHEVKIRDVATRNDVFDLKSQASTVSVAFSPDGGLIATGTGKHLKLWDAERGMELYAFDTGFPVLSVSFSPDGSKVVSGGVKALKVWDIAGRKEVGTIENRKVILSVAYSAHGQHIVSGGEDNAVTVRNADTLQTLEVLKGHSDAVQCVALSADGQRIVSGGRDGIVIVWKAKNDRPTDSGEH